MDPGEEILSTLNDVALREDIRLAEVSALGAINEFTVGLYDRGERRYHSNSFAFDAEIVSLTGTITYANELPYLHLHMPRRITRIGLNDRYAESGEFKALLKKYGLTDEAIIKAVKAF